MEFEDLAWQLSKVLGFVMIAVATSMAAWDGRGVEIPHILLFVFGLVFSMGSIVFGRKKAPSERQLKAMYEKELDELYLPAAYRTFDQRRARYESLHRLRDDYTATGDFSEQKGH